MDIEVTTTTEALHADNYSQRPEHGSSEALRIRLWAGERMVGYIDVGSAAVNAGFVFYSRVDADQRGKGYGTRLYLEAIKRFGRVVTRGHSDLARRVWDSLGRRDDITIEYGETRWVARPAASS